MGVHKIINKIQIGFMVALMVVLSGCMSMDSNITGISTLYKWRATGEFSKIISAAENLSANYDGMTPLDLDHLCDAYFKLRRYDRYFECSDRLNSDLELAVSEKKIPLNKGAWGGGQFFGYENIKSRDLSNMSIARFELGDVDSAVRLSEEAVSIYESQGKSNYVWHFEDGMRIYESAGLIYSQTGNVEKLKDITQKALWLAENGEFQIGQKKASERTRVKVITSLLFWAEDYKGALSYSRDNIEGLDGERFIMFIATFGLFEVVNAAMSTEGMSVDQLYNGANNAIPYEFMLARSSLMVGDEKESLRLYEDLVSKKELSFFPSMHWQSLMDLGRIKLSVGGNRDAIPLFEKAIDIIESQRKSVHTEGSKIGFSRDKAGVYSGAVHALILDGQFERALEYSERGKSRALVDMLASRTQFFAAEPEVNSILAKLEEMERRHPISRLNDVESSQQRTAKELRSRLESKSPEISSLVTVSSLTSQEIQGLLEPNETLIEYFGDDENLFVFLVDRNSIKGFKIDGQGLREDVTALRQWVSSGSELQRGERGLMRVKRQRFSAAPDVARSLYDRLIKPLESEIGSNNITLVPHGVLHYLPFAALHSGQGYLIDKYNLRTLPSASVLKFLYDGDSLKARSILVLGNPDLGDPKMNLPYAQQEAEAITQEWDGAILLVRDQATETAVKKVGNTFRYLHFASHGIFDPEKPLQSCLALAKDADNDGMFTVSELYDTRLEADLVTLSACETALGKVSGGDDVVGFTRGLLYAGAKSIVSSLWKVDDEATGMLMKRFYEELKFNDKRTALRNAQLAMRNGEKSHPFYWAAFQLTGAVN